MGLFSRNKPKIKVQTTKKDGYSGWVKCTHCTEMVHATELEKNMHCCPKCNHHYRLSGRQRIALLTDEGTFKERFTEYQSLDPLAFVDTEAYKDRLEKAKKNSGRDEAILVGTCKIGGRDVALGVLDFTFMAGSMGSVVGERLACLIECAIQEKLPLVVVSASGGARMQESCLSLMQMAKTSAALAKLHEAKLPYLSILTNPTTGGVTASFATLGDIIIAEPDALIAFAGPRVVEQAMRQKLPPGAQKSEFLLERGMVDCIVPRQQLKKRVVDVLNLLLDNERLYLGESDEELLPERLKELLAIAKRMPIDERN